MDFPVIDLHCDLLYYLAEATNRTAFDTVARCAIPQLHKGRVKFQTLAVFTETNPYAVQKGLKQLKLFQKLSSSYPNDLIHHSSSSNHICLDLEKKPITIAMAFENASGFCSESEPIFDGIKRLHHIIKTIAKPLYISLTWNSSNRFGGGAHEKEGLKEDGKRLLDELHEQKIAVDLSHTSDALAYEIIDYIDKYELLIPLIASHSNARAVTFFQRNLPDDIAGEIFRRGGIIGCNLFANFFGENKENLAKHIAYLLELGGENHLALGADFFYEGDFPKFWKTQVFHPEYADASCYQNLLHFLQKELLIKESTLQKFSHKNAELFIKNLSP